MQTLTSSLHSKSDGMIHTARKMAKLKNLLDNEMMQVLESRKNKRWNSC